jgi:hypothetical protein
MKYLKATVVGTLWAIGALAITILIAIAWALLTVWWMTHSAVGGAGIGMVSVGPNLWTLLILALAFGVGFYRTLRRTSLTRSPMASE